MGYKTARSGTERTQAKLDEIEIGAEICKKLKTVYFEGLAWSDACSRVAEKFSILKRIYRGLIPESEEHTDMEMLLTLSKYSLYDIEDIFSHPVPEKKKTIDLTPEECSTRRKEEITRNLGEWVNNPIYETHDEEYKHTLKETSAQAEMDLWI